ncbi:copper resistance protein CopC [Streptomyces chiangmaiensis]|uniref:Copper resistance protein CopC n=1 Tax=Streptomyces chiangmaiensis TaxID=766497 RepID=A0ABU7FPK4_9ACTN|nr:copper resistance protein CopC [Streptomyces chiangmaiensis]MED7826041.1 copper resistance protein CopC [Streptomyces chiangmaiensis]
MFVLLVVPLLLLAGAGSASAHAVLKDADPVDGSVLKTSPRAVNLTFSESVGLLDDSIRVFDPSNRRVHTGEQEHTDGRSDTAHVTLPRLPQGSYIVAWRVVSADSHPVSGALTFSVGKPSATTAVLPYDEAQDAATTTLYDIARYVAYGGLALLLGVLVFAMATGTGVARGLLVGGWWTLLAATVALLLLRGPYERGSGPATAFDLPVLRETATSRPGLALLARLLLLGVAAAVAGRAGLPYACSEARTGDGEQSADAAPTGSGPAVGERPPFAFVIMLSLALALTWAVAEHAAAGIQVPLAMTSAVLHLLAMAVWLGGLAALLTSLYRTPDVLPAAAAARFSRLALASVAVLVATGVYQSWRGLGSLDALTTTAYGRLLTAKVVVVLLLLAAAAYSRRWTARLAVPAADVTAPQRVREVVGAATGRVEAASRDGAAGDVPTPLGPDDRDTASARAGSEPGGPAVEDPSPHRRALRRSVLAEITIGVVVLVITTLLTGTQPGRAVSEAQASQIAAEPPLGSTTLIPFDVGTPGGHGTVQVELTPSRVGENQVQAVIYGPDGGIATVPELRLSLTPANRKIGPLDAKMEDRGGYWAADALNLPLPGTWTMKVTVRTTDIDQVTVSKTVRIG